MCCIPVLCGAIQSQLHIAYQCSAESPLLTMVARTTSGGHYQAHVAVLECVFLYNHCMFFIWYLCFTASRYGVLKAKSLFCSIFSYTEAIVGWHWHHCGHLFQKKKKSYSTHRLNVWSVFFFCETNVWSLCCQHTKMSLKGKASFWTASSGDDNLSPSFCESFWDMPNLVGINCD